MCDGVERDSESRHSCGVPSPRLVFEEGGRVFEAHWAHWAHWAQCPAHALRTKPDLNLSSDREKTQSFVRRKARLLLQNIAVCNDKLWNKTAEKSLQD